MKYGFVLIILSFWGSFYAQRFAFVNYNTVQGLPQSQVTAITQDEKGALWVGTLGGLAQFNGKEFITYTNEDGLLNNRISCLFADKGKVWVGHEGGVSCIYGKKKQKWSFGKSLRSVSVSDLLPCGRDMLIATNGEGLFLLRDGKLSRIKYNVSPVIVANGSDAMSMTTENEDLLKIRDIHKVGNKWYLGTRAGVLVTEDLVHFSALNTLEGYSVSSLQSCKDELWVTTFKNGLFRQDLVTGKCKRIASIDTLFSLRKCFFDRSGNLWVVATEGVFRLTNERISLKLDQQRGLPMESIRCIFQDKSNAIWLGSEGKGLLRFPGEQFTHFSQRDGFPSDLVVSSGQKRDGSYLLGTFDKGLIRFLPNGRSESVELENSSTVWAVLPDVAGGDWLGTENGLVCFPSVGKSIVYYAEDGLSGDKVAALYKRSDHSFYVGGSEGVSIYTNGRFYPLYMREAATVRNFCRLGNTIFCVADNGFYEIRGKQLLRIADFTRAAYSLAVDKQNRIWIGTEEGLFCYDKGKIKRIDFAPSAAANFINFLVISQRGLYIGSNNGLYLIQHLEQPKDRLIHFGISDGLNDLETNLNSAFEDKKGNLWFGTASGFVKFDPNRFDEDISVPSLVVKEILVNYQSDIQKYGIAFNEFGIPASLELPYFKNNLTISLDGIDLEDYAGMQFQFWMEGQDQSWSPLSTNSTISFNGLPAGSYTLHARCVDAGGRTSGIWVLPVSVSEALYRTWWFYILVLSAMGGAVWYGLKTRIKREQEKNEKEMLEYKSRLLNLEQKSLNASMNRHFIFNSLNSIQYFINTQDKISANKFLTNFAKLIRKNLDSSEEGNLVSLQQELERVELYLSLESMRFKDRFDYFISVQEDLDPEGLIIPAMMIQPFVENSIIHGILPNEDVKGEIRLDITLKDQLLLIRISDNGVGVDKSLQRKADFSGDHESKGTDITMKRIQLLRKLTQRDFELTGPIQMNDAQGKVLGTEVLLKIFVENLD